MSGCDRMTTPLGTNGLRFVFDFFNKLLQMLVVLFGFYFIWFILFYLFLQL